MAPRPLPDRERRHLLQFHVLPAMAYGARMAWAAGLVGSGLLVQILLLGLVPGASIATSLVVTLPLLLAGNALLLVRGYRLRPGASTGSPEWEKTTRDRFREVRRAEREVRSWDETFGDVTCMTGCATLLLVGGGVASLSLLLAQGGATRPWAAVVAIDAAALLLPHWVTGTRRGWRPVSLRQQIDALLLALEVLDADDDPPRQIQPMFEMAGEGDRRYPLAARALVRFPDGPEDLLGLQLQVSLNDVQGTKYPYLYAVLIARTTYGLTGSPYRRIREALPDLTVERGEDGDVQTIVIRQRTTRQSGYHTKPRKIRAIARAAAEAARIALDHATRPGASAQC